jgi:trigger factor
VKTTLGEREGNTVKFSVEVSSEEMQAAFDTRLKQLAREMKIPGFRPGKAPLFMVRQRLGDAAILADTVEESMGEWFATAMAELGLDPVERPDIEFGDDLPELEKPFGFSGSVVVMPEVVLGEYKGLAIPKESSEVDDEEVDSQLERLQNEFAELRPISDRAARMGDFVTVDFSATLDGKLVDDLQASDYLFELGGKRMFPRVEEEIVGMTAGQERTFPFEAPEGLGDDAAGKTVDFSVTVKEIKEKVLPQPTDQWASEVSEFSTILELRQEIRNRLKASKSYAADQQFRADAIQKAAANVTLDLPASVVRAEAEDLLADLERSLKAQGATLEGYAEAVGATVDKMLQDISPQAANNVKTRLVLEAVAKAEGLQVGDEEVAAVIGQMATASKVDPKTLEKRLRKAGRLESIRSQLVRDKAASFIVENAVEAAPEPAAAEPASAKKRSRAAKAGAAEEKAAKPAAETPAEAVPAEASTEEAAPTDE